MDPTRLLGAIVARNWFKVAPSARAMEFRRDMDGLDPSTLDLLQSLMEECFMDSNSNQEPSRDQAAQFLHALAMTRYGLDSAVFGMTGRLSNAAQEIGCTKSQLRAVHSWYWDGVVQSRPGREIIPLV
jgi:hypothetical protein